MSTLKHNACLLLAFLLLSLIPFFGHAQFYRPTEKSINVGDRVPEEVYQHVHKALNMKTKQQTTLKLDDYRDKLIILDFWATWCGPCKYSLSKLDSIQATMSTVDFIVVPVNYQDMPEIKTMKFLDKHHWNFTSIIADSLLSQYLPHEAIPYMVWIKDGKFIADPRWAYATAENIRKAASGEIFEVVNSNAGRFVDPSKPLFSAANGESKTLYQDEKVKVVGHSLNYSADKLQYYSGNGRTVLYAVNQGLPSLIESVYGSERSPILHSGDTQWQVNETIEAMRKGPSEGIEPDREKDSIRQGWLMRNTFGFAYEDEGDVVEEVAKIQLQESLAAFLKERYGLLVKKVLSPTQRYLVLSPIVSAADAEQKLSLPSEKAKGIYDDESGRTYVGYTVRDQMIVNLQMALKNQDFKLTISSVVDSSGLETGFRGNFSIGKALRDGASLAEVNEAIASYGLKLELKENKLSTILVQSIYKR